MSFNRRAALALGFGGVAAAGLAAASRLFAAEPGLPPGDGPITVEATPIPALLPSEPDRTQFGGLTFRSGLVLSSRSPEFGGWSGLWRSADGSEIVAVSDRAEWLTARVLAQDGRTSGLTDAAVAPILGENGTALRRGNGWDSECLAIAGGEAFVGFERVQEIRRYAWAQNGVPARGFPLPVPPAVKRLSSNEGLEALAIVPEGRPLAGRLVTIAERARAGDDQPTAGWVLGGEPFEFDVVRSEGFDITDLAFLPSGEALLLERRCRLLTGVACRIRRLGADAFRPGALVDGEVIFEADRKYEIDNMEGMALHLDPASGRQILTLISDDNFSAAQRTILLEFSLG
ncbi:esterase-like activity of phytase family protein [Enterovirga sp. CN4-39]|uniref:esterase-like activity of phytase family protein n=1 Tax=Enterovirga sp. CN4-39 TaxID=3400910 RepID=UPI003C00EC5A